MLLCIFCSNDFAKLVKIPSEKVLCAHIIEVSIIMRLHKRLKTKYLPFVIWLLSCL